MLLEHILEILCLRFGRCEIIGFQKSTRLV